jgi:hypothetical protein
MTTLPALLTNLHQSCSVIARDSGAPSDFQALVDALNTLLVLMAQIRIVTTH